jgi:hemerythrin-like domain-containing protein
MTEKLDAHIGGDASAIEDFVDHGRQYIDLMRGHIGKENPILFGMADQVVHGEALDALTKAYEQAASGDDYCETMKRCLATADRFLEVYGITRTNCQ